MRYKLLVFTLLVSFVSLAKSPIYLDKEKDTKLNWGFWGGFWLRCSEQNPNTKINDIDKKNHTDLSIRRFRFILNGNITERIYFLSILGFNNKGSQNIGDLQPNILDLSFDYRYFKENYIGIGKNGWQGLSRYTSPSSSKILSGDLHIVTLPNIGKQDFIVRRLGVFLKGRINKLNYVFSINENYSFTDDLSTPNISGYSNENRWMNSGYLYWSFFDKESIVLPYRAGSYLGEKKVFNIGAGWKHQSKGSWYKNSNSDTLYTDILHYSVDLYLDLPLSEKKNTLTFYTSYLNYNFGKNYIRNIGVNGGSSGINTSFPMMGTGETLITQLGYLFPKTEKAGMFQLTNDIQYSKYEGLSDDVLFYRFSINWFTHSNRKSVFSLFYENRPYFNKNNDYEKRFSTIILQYCFVI